MNKFVQIREIAIYHPEKVVENEFYFEHFKKQGKDIKSLIENVYGRDKRYVIDPNSDKKENSLTMMIEASKNVLQKATLTGADIDMIVVGTQIPEFLAPACAVLIHHAIEGKKDAFCYDLNANCISMLFAFENMLRYMQSNPKVNRVLLVGGEYTTQVHNPTNELGYGVFGDAACALILERTEAEAGIIDSEYFINDIYCDKMLFPHYGMSTIFDSKKEDILATMESVSCDMDDVAAKIRLIMERNHLSVDDIGTFCFSQFLKKNFEILREEFNIPVEKSIYVGDVYGYTGTSSPFLALYTAIEQKRIKHGDYVLFWTIGAGMQHFVMLIKY